VVGGTVQVNGHPFTVIGVAPPGFNGTLMFLLSMGSGLLFGAVPVKVVLRADPYEILKRGPRGTGERRMTSRDLLLVVQIAICALLVTSSLVAVRGLMRSLHGNFGFEPQHAVLVETDLNMAGYRGEAVEAMQNA
jgi:hypothetical protein